MKAIVQEGYGAPERVLKLEDVDRPRESCNQRTSR
jgi:hypothetical protein